MRWPRPPRRASKDDAQLVRRFPNWMLPMLYAEDLVPSREFPFTTYEMTQQGIIDYARQWDPLPIHIDVQAASAGPHGGIIASGLHTLAVYQRFIVEALWKDVQGIGGRSFQLKFRRPVKPGMILSGRAKVERVEHRPEKGNSVVYMQSVLTDQTGDVVLEIAVDAVVLQRRKSEQNPD